MKTFSEVDSCLGLIRDIEQLGHSINPVYITPKVIKNKGTPFREKHSVEMTGLFDRLLDFLDTATIEWVNRLHDVSCRPDWHSVNFPDGTPVELYEELVVLQSKHKALGYVLEIMEDARAIATGFKTNANGSITIIGDTSEIATIQKIEFEHLPEMSLARATRALKGIHKYSDDLFLAKRLSKLNGFPKELGAHVDRSPMGLENGMLDLSAQNLCWAMQQVLEPVITPAIPLNQVQELTARYYGFESWNHFTGAIKNRADDLSFPYALTFQKAYFEIDLSKPIKFYKGIAAGFAAFGELLISQQRKTFIFDPGFTGHCLTNLTRESSVIDDDGKAIQHQNGIRIKQCCEMDCDDAYSNLAAILLSQNDPETFTKEYFLSGLPASKRIIELNKRKGINAKDHIFIGDWVYYCKRGIEYSDGYFRAESVSNIGHIAYSNFSASLHKLSIVKDDEGKFWFAADWDREPKFLIDGLSEANADRLEKKFVSRQNWRCHS